MKVLLNDGFQNPLLSKILKNTAVDPEDVKNKNIEYLKLSGKILDQEYKRILSKLKNLKKEEQEKVKLPEFNIKEYLRTGVIKKDLYNLMEFGNPFLGIAPTKLMTKLAKLKLDFK